MLCVNCILLVYAIIVDELHITITALVALVFRGVYTNEFLCFPAHHKFVLTSLF
jgi:hypothetical protein